MGGAYILKNISSVSGIHPILNSSAADLQQTLLKILHHREINKLTVRVCCGAFLEDNRILRNGKY